MTGFGTEPFRHEAAVYQGLEEYVALVGAFVVEGVEREEPVLVLTDAARAAALQDQVGHQSAVRYGDMRTLGRNPGRLLALWWDFVDSFAGRQVRGVGEPVWPGRGAEVVEECALHEALANVAFAEGPGWQLLCPYDAQGLESAALALATDHHPVVVSTQGRQLTGSTLGPDVVAALFAGPLRSAPAGVEPLGFDRAGLLGLRHHVHREAVRLGVGGDRADDFTLAVDEAATNSVVHGGGHGTLRLWLDRQTLIGEVSDRGHVPDALIGRRRPPPHQVGGRGLWMANQLCDLVQLRSSPDGTVVRLHMTID